MSERIFNGPLAKLLRECFAPHPTPDPWPEELDQAVRSREAVPICTNCLHPQPAHRWFCPYCHFPTGEYVHLMPYLYVFTWGELLRRGVFGPPEKGAFRKWGLVIYSSYNYSIFAPLYWYWMYRKSAGKPISNLHKPDLGSDDSVSA